MKKIVTGIMAVVFVFVVVVALEQSRHNEFKKFFGFAPSGTDYLAWTGEPNPVLKAREETLIFESLSWKYDELRQVHRKMLSGKGVDYAELRRAFLARRKALLGELKIAGRFGYMVLVNDPDGLLQEEK